MPVEMGMWRIDGDRPRRLAKSTLVSEAASSGGRPQRGMCGTNYRAWADDTGESLRWKRGEGRPEPESGPRGNGVPDDRHSEVDRERRLQVGAQSFVDEELPLSYRDAQECEHDVNPGPHLTWPTVIQGSRGASPHVRVENIKENGRAAFLVCHDHGFNALGELVMNL